VFAAITGETLSDFIRRIRLERAASALGLLHDTSVLEIALRYGFSSSRDLRPRLQAHFGIERHRMARWRRPAMDRGSARPKQDGQSGSQSRSSAAQSAQSNLADRQACCGHSLK